MEKHEHEPAKKGAKRRSPDGQKREKRTVYHTESEHAAYLAWIEQLRKGQPSHDKV